MEMKKRNRAGSAMAAGAATVVLLGLPATAYAAPAHTEAAPAASPRSASPAFQAALAEGRNIVSPDYCYAHANDGGCI
jgi:hypothetical protein